MIGREKPFEILNEKEKEAYQLAAEILLWSEDRDIKAWPGVLELRQSAMQIHEMTSNMDMEHDDRYYHIYDGVRRLRQKYDELKSEIAEYKMKDTLIEIQEQTVEELLQRIWLNIDNHSAAGSGRVNLRQRIPVNSYDSTLPADDLFYLKIRRFVSDRYEGEAISISASELFTESVYKKPLLESVVRLLLKRLNKEVATDSQQGFFDVEKNFNSAMRDGKEIISYFAHRHGGNDLEFTLRLPNMPREEAREIVALILQTIKEHPRELQAKYKRQ